MEYDIRDISLAKEGLKKIDWVSKWMKVVNTLYEKYKDDGVFEGKKIAICIHLEAKTAYLALTLQRLGVEVWITSSNPLSTKDDVCAALAKKGIHVFAADGQLSVSAIVSVQHVPRGQGEEPSRSRGAPYRPG